MAWPNLLGKKDDPPVDDKTKVDDKPKEKSPAELIADSLKPITDQLTALGAKVDAMKPAPVVRKVEPTETPSVLDNEDAAFSARMTPLIQRQLELEAKIARTEIKQEYVDIGFGALWNANEKDIDATLTGTALVTPDGAGGYKAMRGDPQYIRNVVDMIIGRAARAGGVKFNDTSKTFFLEGADGGGNGGERKADTSGLTAKQLKVFQRMGVSLEDAKKAVSKLEFVS
jgi:hypothetical protein